MDVIHTYTHTPSYYPTKSVCAIISRPTCHVISQPAQLSMLSFGPLRLTGSKQKTKSAEAAFLLQQRPVIE